MLLAACAPMPSLGPVADARSPEAFESSQTFKAPESEWPTDRWWEKYKDPQLNQLIEEGLADAPDTMSRADLSANSASILILQDT